LIEGVWHLGILQYRAGAHLLTDADRQDEVGTPHEAQVGPYLGRSPDLGHVREQGRDRVLHGRFPDQDQEGKIGQIRGLSHCLGLAVSLDPGPYLAHNHRFADHLQTQGSP
jgi:hypothetical protein